MLAATQPAQPRNSASESPTGQRVAFIDGIRGWASVMVLLAHLLPCFLARATPAFSLGPLAFLTDGNFAVTIFFVLSGFALSIGAIETGNPRVLTALAVRRYPRLVLPILASCVLGYLLLRLGMMFNREAAPLARSEDWLGTFYTFAPDVTSMLKLAFYDVFFAYDQARSYQPTLWTMPSELLGSAIVFGFCAVFLPLRSRGGVMTLLLGASCALFLVRFPLLAPFLLGVGLAFYSAHPLRRQLEASRSVLIFSLLMLAGVVLYMSVRMNALAEALPARAWIIHTLQPSAFKDAVAATLLVGAVTASLPLRRLFGSPVSRYLGRLSFPLYLTHVPLICSFSSYLFVHLTERGVSGPLRSLIVLAASLPVCWIVAHLFLPVERQAITLARRFSDWIR